MKIIYKAAEPVSIVLADSVRSQENAHQLSACLIPFAAAAHLKIAPNEKGGLQRDPLP